MTLKNSVTENNNSYFLILTWVLKLIPDHNPSFSSDILIFSFVMSLSNPSFYSLPSNLLLACSLSFTIICPLMLTLNALFVVVSGCVIPINFQTLLTLPLSVF